MCVSFCLIKGYCCVFAWYPFWDEKGLSKENCYLKGLHCVVQCFLTTKVLRKI